MHVWDVKHENGGIRDPSMTRGIATTSVYMTQQQGVEDFQIKPHINCLTFRNKFMMHCTSYPKKWINIT